MPKQYNLTIDEIMRQVVKAESGGFAEEEIQAAEARLGVKLPAVYRDYLKQYGREEMNNSFNQLFAPDEIFTSYEQLAKDVARFAKPDEDDEYRKLSQLPQEEWHTVTDNYVLIWCENQGVWNAGYLLSDLQKGVENPPVYLSDNDDFLSFFLAWDNTENFLQSMMECAFSEVSGYDMPYISDAGKINAFLRENGIDKSQLLRKVNDTVIRGNCLDSDNGLFCMYYREKQPDFEDMYLIVTELDF